MGKLNQIDKKAESKGSGVVTLWQFIKFIFVSLGACIVQFGLVNLLPLVFRSLYDTPCDFFVFHYPVSDGGLGYFLSFAISNIAAQIVAFFHLIRKKTFNFRRKYEGCPPDLRCFYHCLDLLLPMAQSHDIRLDSQ